MNSGRLQPEAESAIAAATSFHIPCDYAAIRRGASQLRTFLNGQGLLEQEIWACELAFVEGCNNAVQHTPPAQAEAPLHVEITCSSDAVELRIRDYGAGFDWPRQIELPSPDRESGRGLFLMNTVMDQVNYVRSPSSNCLVLRKTRMGI